ncbi:lamin tail domain-containing protein [candidate division KSB1 bacterium]|nr:lamin tail domain-containing protein [candidate division KSB1 bacterium]
MRLILLTALTILILTLPAQAAPQITLSEIMFDPDESEYYYEFIEIFNLSTTDSIDLTGFSISDGIAADEIISMENLIHLKPRQYGIILDSGYFDHIPIYDDIIPPDALILSVAGSTLGDAGLSNTTEETISVIDPLGNILSCYRYSIDNAPGFSDEKIIMTDENLESNWSNSRTLHGSPGAANTVSPLNHDLSLSISTESKASATDYIVYAHISNLGLNIASQFSISLFADSPLLGLKLIFDQSYDNVFITPFDSINMRLETVHLDGGLHRLLAKLSYAPDLSPHNNESSVFVTVPFDEFELIINEIMFAPHTGHPEWVEIYNPSLDKDIDLHGWKISDSQTDEKITLCDDHMTISPQQYALIAQDTLLSDSFTSIACPVIVLRSNFPTLNNQEDAVALFDLTDKLIDYVAYTSSGDPGTGLSLERFNPDLRSDDAANWSYCTDDRGGTPGRRNSIFIDKKSISAELFASPDPFSPDEDGHEDITIIQYAIPLKTSRMNIQIFDIKGRMVRFLCNNDPVGSNGTVIWDGRDDHGILCRMGIYIIHMVVINEAHAALIEKTSTVVLASPL